MGPSLSNVPNPRFDQLLEELALAIATADPSDEAVHAELSKSICELAELAPAVLDGSLVELARETKTKLGDLLTAGPLGGGAALKNLSASFSALQNAARKKTVKSRGSIAVEPRVELAKSVDKTTLTVADQPAEITADNSPGKQSQAQTDKPIEKQTAMNDARPAANEPNANPEKKPQNLEGKYLTLKLAGEDYGLPVLKVRELMGLVGVTRVPASREYVLGVINIRGKVVPVVDLGMKFGLGKTETTQQSVIIVVEHRVEHATGAKQLTIGILVDEVLEVAEIKKEHLEPPPDFGADPSAGDFILGVGKLGERMVFLLDVDRMLSVNEQNAIAAVTVSAS